jgi:hypothetical protein
MGNMDKGRKLLKIGHALNPRDPVLLQSLALLEYKHSSANLARVLFRRASELDPRHQPVWVVSNISYYKHLCAIIDPVSCSISFYSHDQLINFCLNDTSKLETYN